jgi:hypothetical protein
MATARELLEQADALMRRNRPREADSADASAGIPVLTDIVRSAAAGGDGLRAVDAGGIGNLPRAVPASAALAAPMPIMPAARYVGASEFDDVPVLTDVVADLEPISILGAAAEAGEPSQWPEAFAPDEERGVEPAAPFAVDRGDDRGEIDAAPPPVAAEAGTVLPGAFDFPFPAQPVPADGAAAVIAAAAQPRSDAAEADAERWKSLAEDVRMQVLQRIDIFTDTGLQERLTARLQPIVDRASADLVATINQHVGQLLREYVAEAIEREIEKWRQNGA